MNLESPKTRFLKTADAKWLADLTVNPAFIRCLDVVMLQVGEIELQSVLTGAERMQGAMRFRDTLLRLADPESQRPPPPNDNLNPD